MQRGFALSGFHLITVIHCCIDAEATLLKENIEQHIKEKQALITTKGI